MGTKTRALPKPLQDAFAEHLRRWVADTCDGNQTEAGKALGFTQGHVSAVIRRTRGPGLEMAFALRQKTGMTLDELFGLPPPRPARSEEPSRGADVPLDRIREALRAELAEMRAQDHQTEPPPPPPSAPARRRKERS